MGEALSYVGGALAGADLDAVNLSKKLMDEEKVYIPKIGETIQGAVSESSSGQAGSLNAGKININTAEASELDSLPGIGEAYAKRIIEYRKANGPFKSIEDIKNVTGIGEKRYEAIKDLIMVK
ncbi:ComE operon protein 1 [bioreactor metagenome]|uniref:ComE operon protein 1 n=1 Tax=bioreactor metagenome TaxID=1076179 RepID=A0A645IMM5_9ZZZZ